MNDIVLIEASLMTPYKQKPFMQWMSKKPDNVAVMLISDEPYEKLVNAIGSRLLEKLDVLEKLFINL